MVIRERIKTSIFSGIRPISDCIGYYAFSLERRVPRNSIDRISAWRRLELQSKMRLKSHKVCGQETPSRRV
jgi:hypothetical protein